MAAALDEPASSDHHLIVKTNKDLKANYPSHNKPHFASVLPYIMIYALNLSPHWRL